MLLIILSSLILSAQQPALLAGSGPSTGSIALQSSLALTQAVALDSSGRLYFTSQSRVFRLNPDGSLTRIAGGARSGFSGDGGPATEALLRTPYGIAISRQGEVYISDYGNHRIRKVDPDGLISTIAGNGDPAIGGDEGPASMANLRNPCGLAFDAAGNLYVADSGNHRIRRITPEGIITTVAGYAFGGFGGDDGQATDAQINFPTDVAFDSSGNLYIADYGNHRIRKVSADGTITTIAGRGSPGFEGDGKQARDALFNYPVAIAVDQSSNILVSDYVNHRIRRIRADGTVSTIAGNGTPDFSGDNGVATSANLSFPLGIAVDAAGTAYFADLNNQRIRRITSSGTISTIAGNGAFQFGGDEGSALNAQMNQPSAAVISSSGTTYITDTLNHRLRVISPGGLITSLLAESSALRYPSALALDSLGNLYIADTGNNRIRLLAPSGTVSDLSISPSLRSPSGLAVDLQGNLYISDTGNDVVLRRTPSGDTSVWVPASAGLKAPHGLAIDSAGNLYIADLYNHRILKRSASGEISEFAPPVKNGFPVGVALDRNGALFVAYAGTNSVVRIASGGNSELVIGPSQITAPQGLSLSPGNELIIAASGDHQILSLKLDF